MAIRVTLCQELTLSLRYVNPIARELPYSIASQVLSYARSVDESAEDIFDEAKLEVNAEIRDQLVLIAAIRKLHAICSSSYWILSNSQRILGADVSGIRAGSGFYAPGSSAYTDIRKTLFGLQQLLQEQDLPMNVLRGPYTDVLEFLRNGRS